MTDAPPPSDAPRDDAPPPSEGPRSRAGGPSSRRSRGPASRRSAAPAPAPKPKPTLFGRLVALLVFGYAAGVAFVLVALLFTVDRHWIGTILGYGPRWIFAAPLPIVGLAVLLSRRFVLLLPVAATAFVVFVPILDWSFGLGSDDRGEPIRVVTQNLGAVMPLDDPRFVGLLKETRADVFVVTECWSKDQPKGSPDPDYHFAMDYTMCVLSKYPIVKVEGRPRQDVWEEGGSGEIGVFEIQAPHGSFWILSLQLETVREGLEALLKDKLGGVPELYEKNEERRWESELATAWAKDHAKSPFLAVGDFNMPVESAIYKQYWSKYHDAWSRCGKGLGWTKRTRKTGARIDHVLYDDAWGCADAWLLPNIGSDHRGIAVDLRLLPSKG
jgi:hypothetical protein